METSRTRSSPLSVGTHLNGSALVCIKCSAPNAPDRKFCGSCGSPLYFDCEKCGKPYPGGEKFCGSCGDDVATLIRDRLTALNDQLAHAQRLLSESKFQDAQITLGVVAKYRDVRLDEPVAQARELLVAIPERQRQAEADASRRAAEAQSLVSAGRHVDARRTLEAIPEALRTHETKRLLQDAASNDEEIAHLKQEVKALYEAKRVEELLPKLERLTQLLPGEAKYQALLDKACDAINDRGKRRYASYRFADALQDLRSLPDAYLASHEEAEKLLRRAEEMHFLERRLTLAPWVTPAVEAMTSAFAERAPDYVLAKRYGEVLAERKRSRPSDPRRALVRWRKVPPDEIVLPTEDHAFSRRVVLAEGLPAAAAKLWKAEPARFFSAIGVAMQALGRSVIEARFEFEEKKSALANLSLFKEKPVSVAWGLDCTPSSLKSASISVRDDGAIVLHDLYLADSLLVGTEYDEFGGPGPAREALKAFKESKLADRRSLEGVAIGACLPSDTMIGRWFPLPSADRKTLERMLSLEAKAQIPIPLDELDWTWQSLRPAATPGPTVAPLKGDQVKGAPVMVVAVRKTWMENWRNAFRSADLKPSLIQSDALALAAYAHFEWDVTPLPLPVQTKKGAPTQPLPVEEGVSLNLAENEAIALIDMGALHTNLTVVGENLAWFRSFGVGSHRLTQRLAGAYRLTVAQAEVFKRDPSAAKRFAHLYEIAQSQIDDFQVELERSLRLFRNAFPGVAVRRLFFVGGGSRFDGFASTALLGPDKFFETTSAAL